MCGDPTAATCVSSNQFTCPDMRLSLNWLRDYVAITGKSEALAAALTHSGSEVTGIVKLDADVSKIIVGQVKTLLQHPHADRLKIAKVDVGAGALWEIVCGAPNIAPGQKVAVASVGVRLPNGTLIEERRIRGVASAGMICAEDELGLGADHSGIMVLDADTPVGQSLKTALGLPEIVFDLDLTPNRGDCFSVLGMAREVAATTGSRLIQQPSRRAFAADAKPTLGVRLVDSSRCPAFMAIELRGVTIRPAPSLIRNRLRSMGIRPVNNVVDVTNYVMLALGQPLHAFDAKAITGTSIAIRKARAKERLVTLDGQTHLLTPEMTVIADSRKPLDIAGVMGGRESEITEKTRDVLLTAGLFAPKAVRANHRLLGLSTEASQRFERGVDPGQLESALMLAVSMLVETASVKRIHRPVKVGALPKPQKPIVLDPERATNLLGASVTPKRATDLLTRLGFTVASADKGLHVTPPTWRHDITIEADLIEEIGRLLDYNSMRPTLPAGVIAAPQKNPSRHMRQQLRALLLGAGFSEVILPTFTAAEHAAPFGLKSTDHVRVANPLNSEQAFLRRSLIPGLVTAASRNAPTRETVSMFEFGTVFAPGPKGRAPEEEEKLAWVVVGAKAERLARGPIDLIAERFGLGRLDVRQRGGEAYFIAGQSVIARVQSLSPAVCATFKLRSAAATVVIDLPALIAARPSRQTFTSPSVHPHVERDLAFWLPPSVSYASVERALAKSSPLLTRVACLDVFEKGERRSVTIRLIYQASDRTLTSEEVDQLVAKVTKTLVNTLHVEIRS